MITLISRATGQINKHRIGIYQRIETQTVYVDNFGSPTNIITEQTCKYVLGKLNTSPIRPPHYLPNHWQEIPL